MKQLFSLLKALLLVNLIFLFAGCSIRREIQIHLDKSLIAQSIQINFEGANKNSLRFAEQRLFAKYWNEQNIPNDNTLVVNFLPTEKGATIVINSNNPIWRLWERQDLQYLFVAVDTIETANSSEWRESVYLTSFSWYNFWTDRTLYVTINKDNLDVRTN